MQFRNALRQFRNALQKIVKVLATNSLSRKWLNTLYQRLTFAQMRFFHRNFAKIFRDEHRQVEPGHWRVNFAGQQILLPLSSERFWLDWDIAVSILGQDVEIKETYASLINSSEPPEIFVDIGANYGIHSLPFLTHQIETIAFEPNTSCHDYLREVCALNAMKLRIEDVALGDRDSYVELWYPEKDAWLGSTDISVKQKLEAKHNLTTRRVRQKTLDEYLTDIGNRRLLIKIDAEGSEYRILQGALCTLQKNRPLVLFESRRDDNNRCELFDLFSSQNYGVAHLPWFQDQPTPLLNLPEFLDSAATNFIAVPAKHNEDASGNQPNGAYLPTT
jgi:FkbM family methyltransferase